MNTITQLLIRVVCLPLCLLMMIGCAASISPTPTSGSPEMPTSIVTPHTPNSDISSTNSAAGTGKYQTSVGSWGIGMTQTDLLMSLSNSGMSYQEDAADDGQPWYITDDMLYGMNSPGEDGEVNSLSVVSEKYATSLGIRVGDPSSQVEQLYGDGYNHDDYLLSSCHTWEYFDGAVYLRFWFDDHAVVSQWEISTYSMLDL